MKLRSIAFQPCLARGGRCDKNWRNQGFRTRIRPKTRCFFFTEIWIISLQGGLGPTILKVMQFSICSPKNMGKKLQNELWARPVPSKLSERRPLTFFSPSRHGKWAKRCFSHFSQLLQCKFFYKYICIIPPKGFLLK